MSPKYLISIGAFFLVAADTHETSVLDIEESKPVEVFINGKPVNLLVAPDSKSIPALNSDAAERLGLKQSLVSFQFLIGSESLDFGTDSANLDFGHGTFKRRVAFGDHHIIDGADGEVGPAALPFPKVRFHLGERKQGERNIVLPLVNLSRTQTGTLLKIDETQIHVTFSLSRDESLATATAGAILAEKYGGHFDGDTHMVPVRYGIDRPVRPLTLTRELKLGDLKIESIFVRTADLGSTDSIPEGPEQTSSSDPDEIVVIGKARKKQKNLRYQTLIVGRASLKDCSSITYDFASKKILLSCI